MLGRNVFVLAERRLMSGASRREGVPVAGRMVPKHTTAPPAPRPSSHLATPNRSRMMGSSAAGPRASMSATRQPRAPERDPMDEILPIQDGLDADFPDDFTTRAATAAVPHGLNRRHITKKREDDVYADDNDDGDVEADEEEAPVTSSAFEGVEAEDSLDEVEEEAEEFPSRSEPEEAELVETDAAVELGEDTASANMEEAYRFLLHHIDAEMAAIQRRQEDVKQRRQQKEVHFRHTVKELFDMMESPWLLIPDAVGMPLPATGMDVYVKEELKKRNAKGGSQRAAGDAQNKMLHLALEKNYRNLPATRKQPYEDAARHNDLRRHELKNRLHKGCSKFETYLDHVKECTADMVRRGEVSEELPTAGLQHTHTHTPRPRRAKAVQTDAQDEPASTVKDTERRPPRGRKTRSAATRKDVAPADVDDDANNTKPPTKSARKPKAHNQVKKVAAQQKSKAKSAAAKKAPVGRSASQPKARGKTPATAAKGQNSGKGRATKKPASSAGRGGTKSAARSSSSIPLPTIPGLRLKLKPTKSKPGAKTANTAGGKGKDKKKKKK